MVWRNKPDIDTMTLENLYNDLKVYEAEVKKQSGSSSGSSTQNLAFVSSKNTSSGYSSEHVTAITSSPTAGSSQNSISDAAVCAFLANLTTTNVVENQDLEHINDDDLEEIDLKWQMAMLTVRARRFLKRTGRTIKYNGQSNAGFDKSKIECYNCHKKGHFARECKSPKSGESSKKNAEDNKVTTAMVSCDGLGDYD